MPSEVAVEDAADRARVVDDAVGLAALQDGEALKGPAIGQPALPRRLGEEFGQFVEIGEVDHVRAVEVRIAIARTQVEWIVAVVEKTHGALFIR